MPSGFDSSDSRYDSYDSRDDSRHDSAQPPPRDRARGTVVLTYIGLSLNMFVLFAVVWGLAYGGMLNMLLLPLLGLMAVTGLTVNVLGFVFGRLAARSEMPAAGKAACRVCVVVALLQVMTVLALAFIGVERLWGQLVGPPPVVKPMGTVPKGYGEQQSPPVADERPAARERGDSVPTKQESGK